ncbi:phosphoadenylyl-sulfate reductase [Salinicoccus carnicancri]|uniref:phosphoadenylyl-sulfate reductase n=1 Tax=Salinicoccus carnicancri TaxID=558170 RepID=UPI0002E8003C|nr:phosphoadenylyl-sulfate reductase [Salinicoccus carnicancri]
MAETKLSYEKFTVDPFQYFSPDDETKGADRVLEWAYGHFGESLIYACSFGAEAMVLIDLISRVKRDAKIVFLDTALHFRETYDLIDRVRERYPGLRITLKKPHLSLDRQAEEYGDALWQKDPNQCCYIRKIKPLEEVLSGADAWLSGLRRAQSPGRRNTDFVNRDERFKSIKICPLIHWTWEDVWDYITGHNLPYNTLHDSSYPSIGCIPCTSQTASGGDSRDGRWAGTNKTECGLHSSSD